jgi:hypothetical protein
MKYAIEMGSSAMMYEYLPSLIKILSLIQKLIRRDTHYTQTVWRSQKSAFIFSKEGN